MAKYDKTRLQVYISVTNITIVLCWVSLLSFWAIKLMGGNWFEVVVNNQNFIAFSNTVQNTWLKYLVSLVTITIGNYFLLCAVCQRFYLNSLQVAYHLFASATMWFVANFIFIDILQICYGYFLIILFGIIFQNKWKKIFGALAVAIEFVFLTISLLTRNVSLEVSSNYMFSLILCIDVYIMYALYYLYINLIRLKKG